MYHITNHRDDRHHEIRKRAMVYLLYDSVRLKYPFATSLPLLLAYHHNTKYHNINRVAVGEGLIVATLVRVAIVIVQRKLLQNAVRNRREEKRGKGGDGKRK